jgi:glycine/D-amino acid oxidase-like deaminating enzyme
MTDSSFDLIVVGGGVFGLSTALEAGRRRRKTLVVDRRVVPNPIAASFGPSRKIRSTYLDPHYTRLALEAMATWRQIEAETGAELYVADGNLSVSDGTTDAHLEDLAVNARRGGAKIRWLDAADLRRVAAVSPGATRPPRRRRASARHRLRAAPPPCGAARGVCHGE